MSKYYRETEGNEKGDVYFVSGKYLIPVDDAIQELTDCLTKYQSRYHGATHAQKLWDRSAKALAAIPSICSKTEPQTRIGNSVS